MRIEEKLQELASATEQVFAVIQCHVVSQASSVPDEKKGERIAVLHLSADQLNSVLEQLSQADLPPLWKPNQFFFLEALPYLGTGKWICGP